MNNPQLSPEGRARREQMLQHLGPVVRRRGIRNLILRTTTAVAFLALSATALYSALQPHQPATVPPAPVAFNQPAAPTPVAPTPKATTIEFVATDPTIVASLSPRPTTTIDHLTDAQLMAVLREAGRPAGLVRTGGRLILSTDLEPDERLESEPD